MGTPLAAPRRPPRGSDDISPRRPRQRRRPLNPEGGGPPKDGWRAPSPSGNSRPARSASAPVTARHTAEATPPRSESPVTTSASDPAVSATRSASDASFAAASTSSGVVPSEPDPRAFAKTRRAHARTVPAPRALNDASSNATWTSTSTSPRTGFEAALRRRRDSEPRVFFPRLRTDARVGSGAFSLAPSRPSRRSHGDASAATQDSVHALSSPAGSSAAVGIEPGASPESSSSSVLSERYSSASSSACTPTTRRGIDPATSCVTRLGCRAGRHERPGDVRGVLAQARSAKYLESVWIVDERSVTWLPTASSATAEDGDLRGGRSHPRDAAARERYGERYVGWIIPRVGSPRFPVSPFVRRRRRRRRL